MKPFDADTLQLEVEEGMNESEQLESIRQQVESTIRWRAKIDENGDEVKGQYVYMNVHVN